MKRNQHYEADDTEFSADHYTVSGWRGIAFYVLGWETEPDEDTEWSGIENRTGKVVAVMVGDDYHHLIDPEDLTPLDEDKFCHTCGQVGCSHNVYASA